MSSMPLYMNAAAVKEEKVERLKMVIVQAISYYYAERTFEKPVESLLGETLQAYGQDGSQVFME